MRLFMNKYSFRALLNKITAMKTTRSIIGALVLSASLMACHNHTPTNYNNPDSASSRAAKADTAVVAGNQKNIKDDSLSGDPSSKGAADPNAKLPKK
jgi:hypothetical protein